MSHRPAPPDATRAQTFVTSIDDAITAARAAAGDLDVDLMGGAILTAALARGLVDDIIIHQVPVLLGNGRRHFGELPDHLPLNSSRLSQHRGSPTCITGWSPQRPTATTEATENVIDFATRLPNPLGGV